MLRKTLKPFDLILILAVSACIAAITAWVYAPGSGPAMLSVQSDAGVDLYPLDPPRRVEAKGPLGTTVIELSPAGARVLSSPCRDKLCILKGHLHKSGDWTACMPNRVFVAIKGGGEEALDELSY